MRLLVTGAWRCTTGQLDEIRAMGHDVLFMQYEKDALPCAYDWPEGVVCNGLFLSHPIERFINLRFIQLTSAGYDRVPMDYVNSHGIEIHNARGVYSIPMAEFALCGVLQLYKQSRFFYDNQKARLWEKNRELLELHGRIVAIIGCGDVGRECAGRFAAFGCNIIEVHRDLKNLDQAVSTADIVVVTMALTEETRGIIRPSMMKPGGVLVSISRGAVVDMVDLLNANQLLGAVLDVFEEEPLPADSPLWDRENVLISPHNSFIGDGNNDRMWNVIKAVLSS